MLYAAQSLQAQANAVNQIGNLTMNGARFMPFIENSSIEMGDHTGCDFY
jgi:hypothetical protein